jgi:hypothetical protein
MKKSCECSLEKNETLWPREERLCKEEIKPYKYALEKSGNPVNTPQRIEETLRMFPREETKPLNAP